MPTVEPPEMLFPKTKVTVGFMSFNKARVVSLIR